MSQLAVDEPFVKIKVNSPGIGTEKETNPDALPPELIVLAASESWPEIDTVAPVGGAYDSPLESAKLQLEGSSLWLAEDTFSIVTTTTAKCSSLTVLR